VGGVPEFVVDGRTGWLADGRTSEALAATMRRSMVDPRRPQLGRAARARVIGTYSMQSMCEGYGAVYAGLASAPHECRDSG
jgi:glycosyltransferase involved in cell wall biosynthesis